MCPAPTSLPALLPPPVAAASATDPVVEEAVGVVHALLDELRAGPLRRAGDTVHEFKDDGTPVTPVDVEVDERIVATLTGRFPGHGVVSEEGDAVVHDLEWQWVVDPIDGTSNFASGLPHYGVSIALCHGGVPVLGVVDAPRIDHRWVAVRGRSCRRDDAEVHVRRGVRIDDPTTSHLPLLTSLGLFARVNRRSGVRLHPRVLGAAAVDAALVADGTAVASIVTRGRVWDVAAAAVLVEGGGGASLSLAGEVFPLTPGVDHTDLATPSVFGPDTATTTELIRRLWPPTGSLLPG